MATGNIDILLRGDNSDLSRALNASSRQVDQFTRRTKSSFNQVGGSIKKLITGNWQLFGGLIAGAAIYKGIRAVDEFDDKIVRIGIDANMSTASMLKFKEQVLDTGIRTGVATDDLTAMSSAAYKSSKNIDFVSQEMTFMAKVAQASGANAAELGETLGAIQKATGLTGQGFEDLITTLGAFGKTKLSRSSLAEFLPNSSQLIKIAKMIDPSTGARFQKILMEGMMAGNPQAVAKAYAKLLSPAQNKYLRSLGLNPKDFNSVTEVISKIMGTAGKTQKQKLGAIGRLLGIKSEAELEPLITNLGKIDMAISKLDREGFMKGADTQAQTFSASLNRVNAAMLKIGDAAFAPALDAIGKALSSLSPEDIRALADVFTVLGKVLGETVGWLLKIPGASEKAGEALSQFMHKRENLEAARERWGYGPVDIKVPGAPGPRHYQQSGGMGFEVGGQVRNLQGSLIHNETNVYIDGTKIKPDKVITKTGKTGKQATVAAGVE